MTTPDLTPEQEAHAQELARTLHKALEGDILQMTRLLASKPDHQVLGQTEFQIRDIVHTIDSVMTASAQEAKSSRFAFDDASEAIRSRQERRLGPRARCDTSAHK